MTGQERSSALVRWGAVCVDCGNADELALFYSKLLGWEIGARNTEDPDGDGEAGWVELRNPPGTMGLCFQGEDDYEPPVWPEQPGLQAKMIHFEMGVIDLEAAVLLAVEAGATVAPYQAADRDQNELRVMLDPAGHPFCLCA